MKTFSHPSSRSLFTTNPPRKPCPPLTVTRRFVQKPMAGSPFLRRRPADHRAQDASHGIVPAAPSTQLLFKNCLTSPTRLQARRFEVAIHHDRDQIRKVNARLPVQSLPSLARVRQQVLYFERTHIAIAGLDVLAPIEPRVFESGFGKLLHGMRFSGY